MAAFERFDIVQRQCRKPSSIGLFGTYDANILGGLLHGIGMALTGACPGTVLVQLATGIGSGVPTAVGNVFGGILYSALGNSLQSGALSSTSPPDTKEHTIQAKFDVSPNRVLFTYEVISLIIVGISTIFGPSGTDPLLSPIAGGALIGAAQGISLLFTGRAVGVSSVYEDLGRFFWYATGSEKQKNRPPSRSMIFALGIFVGSFILARIVPIAVPSVHISPIRALIGGVIMVFGARLAGGCTSGHGISGMSTFSISSIITVAAMFGGGILTAKSLA